MLLLSVAFGATQTRQRPSQKIDPALTVPEVDESRERLERSMAKKANQERQAALKSDTDKLVKLAGELKDYVDKSNENVLSLSVLKKAEEIEKLARSVREKMKGAN
jgi:TolA-binding protein